MKTLFASEVESLNRFIPSMCIVFGAGESFTNSQ